MTKIIFVLSILVLWMFLAFIEPKLKENYQKKGVKLC